MWSLVLGLLFGWPSRPQAGPPLPLLLSQTTESQTDLTTETTPAEATNTPPVANDQTVIVPEDTPVGTSLMATDPDNDPLTFHVPRFPINGILTGTAPDLIYTPTVDFHGEDRFTFQVHDGQTDSNEATVTLTVIPLNDNPVAHEQQVMTDEDTPLPISLIGSDSENDSLTFSIVTPPRNGTLSVLSQVPPTSAEVTYTLDPNFTGTDSFTFQVDDGNGGMATALIDITVNPLNDPPVISLNGAVDEPGTDLDFATTFTEDGGPVAIVNPTALTVMDVDDTELESATALIANPLNGVAETLAAKTSGTAIVAAYDATTGILSLTGLDTLTNYQRVLRTVTYNNTAQNPDPTDRTVEFIGNDGIDDSPIATVTVTVIAVNDEPVADGQRLRTQKDVALFITLTGSDADSDPLTFSILVPPPHGSLGAITQLPPASAEVIYVPQPNFVGTDRFVVEVDDGNGGLAKATIKITVQAVPDGPEKALPTE